MTNPFLKASVLVASLLAPMSALANDSTAVLEAGGLRLVRDAPIEILSETLFVSAKQITVDYTFLSADDTGTTTLVAFPMPEYDLAWNGAGILGIGGENVQSRTDFRLWIDGIEQAPNLELKAMRNGIDITSVLQDYEIPVGSLDYDLITTRLRTVPQSVRDQMALADIVRWNGPSEPEPLWTIKATYYWSQTFPPGRTVQVRHTYRPVAGMFFISDPQLRDFTPSDFCMSEAEKQGARNRLANSQYQALLASQVRYILTTGANWHGPIQTFHLILDKGTPESMVSLCFDGLKKTGPTRFEATIANFTPTRELDVLFLGNTSP